MRAQQMSWTTVRGIVLGATCVLFCVAAYWDPARAADPARGLEVAHMDLSVKRGKIFFKYPRGAGVNPPEFPADRSRWGVFDELVELNQRRTADLIKGLSE